LKHPFQLEVLDVRGRDLRQRAVAMSSQIARIREPVLWLALPVKDAIEGHLLRLDGEPQPPKNEKSKPKCFSCFRAFVATENVHGRSPFSDTRYATTSSSSAAVSLSR